MSGPKITDEQRWAIVAECGTSFAGLADTIIRLRRTVADQTNRLDRRDDAVKAIRDTMQREHDLGRIALGGYVRLLDAVLADVPSSGVLS